MCVCGGGGEGEKEMEKERKRERGVNLFVMQISWRSRQRLNQGSKDGGGRGGGRRVWPSSKITPSAKRFSSSISCFISLDVDS